VKNLKVLWIQGNPFSAPGHEKRLEKIVAQLQVLEFINGDPASNFKRGLKDNSTAGDNQSQKPKTVAPTAPSQMSRRPKKLDKK
jgi:hypothetical protein